MSWEAVIGLEVHVQLATASKLFAPEPTGGEAPNSAVGPVSLGLPGTLPTPNREAVALAVKAGLALGCDVRPWSEFARKNYFYPDMPKGYQITQYEDPICLGGTVDFEVGGLGGAPGRCRLTRIHLEEDAGKSTHGVQGSLIDYNRAGTPLIEIVSEPELRSPDAAEAFLRALHEVLVALGVTHGNLEAGHFRCDANVSVRRIGDDTLGTRTETKNLNSFRFVNQAIAGEIGRQIAVLEAGGTVVQETRLFDGFTGAARTMRRKEAADDYRYFPDPDLLPLVLESAWIEAIAATLPELPAARRARFEAIWGLSPRDAATLGSEAGLAAFFEAAVAVGEGPEHARQCTNLILGGVLAALNAAGESVDALPFDGAALGALAAMLADGRLSATLGRQVLDAMVAGEGSADEIVTGRGLSVIRDEDALTGACRAVLAADPDNVARYRAGERKLFGYLMGSAMRALKGKGDAGAVRETLQRLLDEA